MEDQVMGGGRRHVGSKGGSAQAQHQREIDRPKKTISEQAVIADQLKIVK